MHPMGWKVRKVLLYERTVLVDYQRSMSFSTMLLRLRRMGTNLYAAQIDMIEPILLPCQSAYQLVKVLFGLLTLHVPILQHIFGERNCLVHLSFRFHTSGIFLRQSWESLKSILTWLPRISIWKSQMPSASRRYFLLLVRYRFVGIQGRHALQGSLILDPVPQLQFCRHIQ